MTRHRLSSPPPWKFEHVSGQLDMFSGMRPLSEVLEQRRIITAARQASTAEPEIELEVPQFAPEFVYARQDDGLVIEYPVSRLTPKQVRFRDGPHEYSASRDDLERDGRTERWDGLTATRHRAHNNQWRFGVVAVCLTREGAEAS